MWYHWLNGNKVHVLKTINSILIGAQVKISNICTFEFSFLKMNEKQQSYGLMKIQVNLGHLKVRRYNLAMIFFIKNSHKSVLFHSNSYVKSL